MRHQDHPGLSNQINFNIAASEAAGGANIKKLRPGQRLKVTTRNSTYYIKAEHDHLTIQGHERICPTPTRCNIHGSTWGGSMLKMDFVGVGMFLEFGIIFEGDARTFLTSEIQKVEFLS